MTDEGLWWHQRERLRREGTLGPLGGEAPETLRTAIIETVENFRPLRFITATHSRLQSIFGSLPPPRWSYADRDWWSPLTEWLRACSRDELLTALEVMVAAEPRLLTISLNSFESREGDTFDRELNRVFVWHRFGFEMSPEGKIREIGSETLHEAVLRPALLRLQDDRFREAEEHFHTSLDRFRGRETRRAIFEASTAVEAMLHALGYQGTRLDSLAEDYSRRSGERGYLTGLVRDLTSMMDHLNGLRGDRGGHAARPGEPETSDSYALLAIHLAGSIIVFLADRASGGE